MPLPLLLQLISTSAIVTGSLCAILAYLRGSKTHQQSLNAQVFLSLTERHASLIEFRRLEADLRLNDHWNGDLETAVAIREYFDLLAHEFALVDLGILDQRVWNIWQSDIKRIVNTQLISEVWNQRTRHLHRASPAFTRYIDSMLTHQRGVFADGHTGSSIHIPPQQQTTRKSPQIKINIPAAISTLE
ncbi:MAG: hypothetical protein P1U30_09470 [Phycisphaerales bacterium]|nr:hypothetical protein [Phycisphaerales bacterium]